MGTTFKGRNQWQINVVAEVAHATGPVVQGAPRFCVPDFLSLLY